MRVSTSAYYAWTNNPDRQNKTKEEAELKAKIEQISMQINKWEPRKTWNLRKISDQ